MSEPSSPLNLDQVLNDAVESAKAVLVDCAKQKELILPTVILHRGGEQIAVMTMGHADRDDMLTVADTANYIFEPDQLTLVNDTWYALVHPNPVTGKPWQNDLGDTVANHRGRENGWVADALTVMAVNRAGDIVHHMMPYRIRGRKVIWLEEHFDTIGTRDTNAHLGGIVPDRLRAMMSASTVSQDMSNRHAEFWDSELTKAANISYEDYSKAARGEYERVRAQQDCAGVKVMMNPPPVWPDFPRDVSVSLSADPGSVRQMVIIESFGGKPWSDS